jgi:hypothetical protein
MKQQSNNPTDFLERDSDRVAGGETMSTKTSTAALASFRRGSLHNQRRAPRHPTVARSIGTQRSNQEHQKGSHEFRQAQLAVYNEDTMHPTAKPFPGRNFISIVPVILRITLSLILYTLGASAMDLRITQTRPKEHRSVLNFPFDRVQAEDLQRWVNAGHDPWCRDPQLVAAAALRRLSSQFAETELVSFPVELENSDNFKAVYTYHSLDARFTYRITLRRYRFLIPTAGTLRQTIWLPETAEIVTRDAQH